MSAGLFEPLLRQLTSKLLSQTEKREPTEEFGNLSRLSPKSLEDEMVDWARRDGGVVSVAAVRMAAYIVVWLLVAVATVAAACLPRLAPVSVQNCVSRCPKKLRPALAATAAVGALAAAGAFSHVSRRQLSLLARSNDSEGQGDSPGAQAAVTDLITAAETLLSGSVRQANATLSNLCAEAVPQLRNLLAAFAGHLAAALSGDALLTPLLAALNEFVETVKRVVASMTAVAASRGGVSEELVTLKALVDDIRTRSLRALESACAELGTCGDLVAQLGRLVVQPSASRLDADASVTAVTLLDRVFRLNVTELDQRVQQAKSAIAAALGSVDGPVGALTARLSTAASDGLQRCLDAIADFSEAARGGVEGPEATVAVERLRTVTVILLASVWATVAAVLVSLVRLGRSKPDCRSVAFGVVESCALALLTALFVAGAAAAAIAAAAEAEGCAPLTTPDGRRALDARLDEFLRLAAWPTLRRLAAPVPTIRLGPEPPPRVLQSLLSGCGPNRTLAQALGLNLSQLVDTNSLLDLPLISGQLAMVKAELKKQLLGGAADSLVPSAEVSNVLVSLAQFATVLDPVDYSASILELSQPLFQLDNASLAALPDRLAVLGRQALAWNATDPRGFRLAMEADRLRSLLSDRAPAVSAGLAGLRRQFETLQGHRTLGRLTAGLAARLGDFRAGLARLSAGDVDRRFDESFNATRPQAADLLADLLGRALAGVGRCDGLLELVDCVGGLCQAGVQGFRIWGGWLQATCACWLLKLAAAAIAGWATSTGRPLRRIPAPGCLAEAPTARADDASKLSEVDPEVDRQEETALMGPDTEQNSDALRGAGNAEGPRRRLSDKDPRGN